MSGEGITPVNDWHRMAQLQKQVRDLEVTVAKLDQLLSGQQKSSAEEKQRLSEYLTPPKRTLLQRILRKKPTSSFEVSHE